MLEIINVNKDSAEAFPVQQACLVAAHTGNYIRNGALIFLVWPDASQAGDICQTPVGPGFGATLMRTFLSVETQESATPEIDLPDFAS